MVTNHTKMSPISNLSFNKASTLCTSSILCKSIPSYGVFPSIIMGNDVRRKGKYFIIWGQLQPLFCNLGYFNGENQFKDCNATTLIQYFVSRFVLTFFHIPYFCSRRHNLSQWMLTSPLNVHIFCKNTNHPNPSIPLDS